MLIVPLLVTLSGCGDDTRRVSPEREPGRGSPHDTAEPSRENASLWPDAIVPLGESAERDETREACLTRERAAVSTEVAEALADIGYDTFFEDVCTGAAAARAADPRLCERITSEPVREGCTLRVAVLAKRPDACPRDATEGRDPLCVAWAARSLPLCRGASSHERARCRAVLRNEPRACHEASELAPARCEALVARLGPVVGRPPAPFGRALEVASSLRVTPLDGTAPRDGGAAYAPDPPVVDRGHVLLVEGCEHVLVLSGPTRALGRGVSSVRLALRMSAGARAPLSLPLGRGASLEVPGPAGSRLDGTFTTSGAVRVERFGRERGATITLVVDATLGPALDRHRVEGTITTFVRDADPLPAHCPR